MLQDRETRRKKEQAELRRTTAARATKSNDRIAELGRRLDKTVNSLAEVQQRVAAAEKRAAAAEEQVKVLEKKLAKTARQAGDAYHRAERAVRIPTRLKEAVSRGRRER